MKISKGTLIHVDFVLYEPFDIITDGCLSFTSQSSTSLDYIIYRAYQLFLEAFEEYSYSVSFEHLSRIQVSVSAGFGTFSFIIIRGLNEMANYIRLCGYTVPALDPFFMHAAPELF